MPLIGPGNGLAPCSLDPGQRNIVPDLGERWVCGWAGCEERAAFSQPQHFYTHVASHAEVSSQVMKKNKPFEQIFDENFAIFCLHNTYIIH